MWRRLKSGAETYSVAFVAPMHLCNLKTLIKDGSVMLSGLRPGCERGGEREGSPKGRSEGSDGCAEHRSPRKPVDEPRGGKALRYKCIKNRESSGESERLIKSTVRTSTKWIPCRIYVMFAQLRYKAEPVG